MISRRQTPERTTAPLSLSLSLSLSHCVGFLVLEREREKLFREREEELRFASASSFFPFPPFSILLLFPFLHLLLCSRSEWRSPALALLLDLAIEKARQLSPPSLDLEVHLCLGETTRFEHIDG